MDVNIRPCGPEDAAALALVSQATFLETYATVLPAADILAHCRDEHSEAAYATWLGKRGCSVWAAEVAGLGALLGYVLLCPPDLPTATEPADLEIRRIYLLSRFQGAGLGARLLNVAIDAARARGARKVWLAVYGENAGAIDFYARQGFAQAGVLKFQAGANTYDDLVLARDV